jgi:hypothetical protein
MERWLVGKHGSAGNDINSGDNGDDDRDDGSGDDGSGDDGWL